MYNPLSKSNFGKTFFILFLTLAFSCKKDSVQPAPAPTYPIEGVWTGTYTQDDLSNDQKYGYSFAIYPDGTLITKGAANDNLTHYSAGTWTLSNDSLFSATITTINIYNSPVTQNISAIFSNKGTLSNGVWANTTPVNGINYSGKFSLQRVN